MMRDFPPLRSALLLALAALPVAACGGAEETSMDEAEAPAAEAPAQASPDQQALLDPNDASEAALSAVPGMTAEAASALVEARPFSNMLEVDAVLAGSMDEAAREEVYRSLFLPLDLNEASEEEILLIPGVGDRMAHEFDEYRPYDAIQRFRREIGKYVDEAEVARLERYVEIR
jgi:DNA uptake protein ComE-like DNA-binding protein